MNIIKSIWTLINFSRSIFFGKTKDMIFISRDSLQNEKIEEIKRRLSYFDPSLSVQTTSKLSFTDFVNFKSVVFVNTEKVPRFLKVKKNDVFNLDFRSNYLDGWDYHYLIAKNYREKCLEDINTGRQILSKLKDDLQIKYKKTYIFGTGPSLENAINYKFDDGIRIVSNTIVKDEELWLHLNPHFIVAGDAIYHFGIGKFAQKFRRDLKLRMSQTDTYFTYPAHFHPFCLKEFVDFKDRLIPIPIGTGASVHTSLFDGYSLPIHGNVLLLLLLPLACYISKDVNLWGFDGRSPNDKLFWKNSSKHFYTEDVDELMNLHPLFFEKLVPKESPESYVKKVHGDVLENALLDAEKDGFKFSMLHHSYTETLARRHNFLH